MKASLGCPGDKNKVTTLGPHQFDDLHTVIDSVHALFAHWEQNAASCAHVDVQTFHRVKLATHEWLANLVQHAAFRERRPYISVEVSFNHQFVSCVIEDNSEGFDLHGHFRKRGMQLEPCPERGMGLLMLNACTDDLAYQPVDPNRNRLSFTITASKDPWLDIPFHF